MHFLQVIPEGVNGEKGNLLNCIHPNQVEVLPKDLADWYGWRRNDRAQVVPPAIFWTTGAWSCPCCSRRSRPTWLGRTFWDLVMLPALLYSPVASFVIICFYLVTIDLPDRVLWRNQLWQHHQVVLTLWRFCPLPPPQTGCLFLSGSPWDDFQVKTTSR